MVFKMISPTDSLPSLTLPSSPMCAVCSASALISLPLKMRNRLISKKRDSRASIQTDPYLNEDNGSDDMLNSISNKINGFQIVRSCMEPRSPTTRLPRCQRSLPQEKVTQGLKPWRGIIKRVDVESRGDSAGERARLGRHEPPRFDAFGRKQK